MSKVLVDRELLERTAAHLEWDGSEPMTTIQFAHKCDALADELRRSIAQPAEAEGVGKWSELKKLAEAFPSDLDWDSNTEPFFNGPTGESLGGGSDGTYTVYGKPFRLEGEDYDYDGPTYVERCNVEFAKFMVAARDGVLGLIAALSAVTAERDNYKSWYDDAMDASNIAGFAGMSAAQVIDYQDKEIMQLRAEVEGMRKDAERWRYVRFQGDDMHWLNILRVDLDDFRGNIDAAVDALINGEAPAMAAKEA